MQLETDPDLLAGYLTDASNLPGQATGLWRPRTTEEVAEVVRRAQAEGVPLTVTAQRTSTTGAPVPRGGWLLSTEHLTGMHAPDEVGAGAILGQFQDACAQQGRLFPPDPTSRHDCTVGAAIACNASGARSFAFGATRPWVEAVEAVLPDGSIVRADRDTPLPVGWTAPHWSEPHVKTAAGFFPADNLLDVLIGSEGTLGIVTRAWVRTTELPAGTTSLLAFFEDRDSCLAFAGAVRDDREALGAVALEYYGPHALDRARQRVDDVPDTARHACYAEIDHDGEAPLEAWLELLMTHSELADHTLIAEDDAGTERLRAVRHTIPASINEEVVRNGMPKVGTDFSVPWSALPALMDAYRQVPLPQVLFGHLGDAHLHLNLLPRTAEELAVAKRTYRELATLAVSLGGTVSAEHGIGKLKRQLLADMVGPDVLAGFRALKAAADPAWVLGRGTLLAPPEPTAAEEDYFRY